MMKVRVLSFFMIISSEVDSQNSFLEEKFFPQSCTMQTRSWYSLAQESLGYIENEFGKNLVWYIGQQNYILDLHRKL